MKKRFWLFLLLVPVAFFMVKLNFESLRLVALYGGTAAIEFGAGGLALFWTANGKRTWVRFVPLALLAVPLYWAWQSWNAESFLAIFAVLIYVFAALCGLCGWGAAWGLTGFESFGPEEPATGEKEEPAAAAADGTVPAAESVPESPEPAADEAEPAESAPESPEPVQAPAADGEPGE